jgi:AmmeMemoRadiSam system protein A
MHPLVELARKSIEAYIREGKMIEPPETLTPEMNEKAGVFVCIKKDNQLRGCIGTFSPSYACVAIETIKNAISAATRDPRFQPVQEGDLEGLEYCVDVLSPPEKVKDIEELNPKKYGIILNCGNRKGLLLPDIEGVDTVEEQIRITRLKACILPEEKPEIYRFEVTRYK